MIAAVLLVLAVEPSGTATVPLKDLVELMQPATSPESASAAVTALKLTGRPGAAGLWIEVDAAVRVLSGRGVAVPLLRLPSDAIAEGLPDSGAGVIVVRDGEVIAVCEAAGSVRLQFKLLLRAVTEGRRSTVRFSTGPAVPPAPLRLEVDDGLFDVSGATPVRELGGRVVFPAKGQYQVSWTTAEALVAPKIVQRLPVDLLVREASSRWVMTLEGRATHQVKLSLQIDRPATLAVTVPEGQRLVRARVNGQPVEPGGNRQTELAVAPASPGASDAEVELSLAQDFGVFHLSGSLELTAPQLGWPVSRWTTEAVLPSVFRWTRRGGSMEQKGEEAPAQGDVPGKSLVFTQHLIASSAAAVWLDYSVDLTNQYFR